MKSASAVSRLSRRAPIPYVVLLAGVVATVLVALYLENSARRKDEIRFDGAVQRLDSLISTTVDTYVALLRAGAGLFAASEDVSPGEFREFVARLDLREHYPGIQGIGFAKRVGPQSFPIVYLEPLDRRNQAALGYDMFAEPVRRAAMERAARTGIASASGKVSLKQEIDPLKQAGFLIYVPVYRRGAPLGSEQERMTALLGFVYSPFRAGDFLNAVLHTDASPELSVRVYDGDTRVPEALLFASDRPAGHEPGRSGRFQRAVRIEVCSRSWVLDVMTELGFEQASERRLLPWVLFVGFGVSLLLSWLTNSEVKARTAAEEAAAGLRRSEEALRASEAELRRLVEAERAAHAEAEEANRAKDEFLATLSHELRTPLNAILGWATMLQRGALSPEQQARAVEVIGRNAQTQAQLIEDLLDVSRIITGKLRVEMQPTRLATPIEAALDAVRPAAEAKGVELDRHLLTDQIVLGDPDRLQQVAWNLLSNAIKFTPAGGRVTARVTADRGDVVFTVQDTGVGIDPEFLPHVFERFRQHDSSTTRAHGGMGLGLAIVRHLVELHGGTISAHSEGEGRGASFVVRLPARAVRARETPAMTPARETSSQELAGVRALVVDDECDSREMLKSVLEQAGAYVATAASADEALKALERQRFDVLLADISMPEVDGYALLGTIRNHPQPAVRTMPALAVTAHAREEDRREAEAAGFQAHLAKPVDIQVLCDTVRELAGRGAARRLTR